jgi:hypothetical protein
VLDTRSVVPVPVVLVPVVLVPVVPVADCSEAADEEPHEASTSSRINGRHRRRIASRVRCDQRPSK